ncbi:hypothetical protein [Chryseobacterium sp. T20]|uniref:hypothetical protein n=1 Tax=Chryseobacterium sp. T20 TaxID=3395375 RepID=UPI0039BD18E8
MNIEHFEAIGHFLAYYRSDLFYINEFKKYQTGYISDKDYISRNQGSFYTFLVEFRVVRNFAAGQVQSLLEETTRFIELNSLPNVDEFALKLSQTDLTRKKIVTSMASKILFLNNPCSIIPMDSRGRRTLGQKVNIYNIYNQNVYEYITKNENNIREILDYVKPITNIIHQEFPLLKNIDLIAKNRIIDKLLWTSGK